MARLWAMFLAVIFVLLLFCLSFPADNPTDQRVLILVGDVAVRSSHSVLFRTLQARGFDLNFKLADDPKLSLQRYGQYLYDGLILFSSSTQSFGGSLDQKAVLDFVDAGHDLILAVDSSDLIKRLFQACHCNSQRF